MAPLPANDGVERHGADVVDSILLIPTHEIVATDRLRAIDPVWASALAQLMARDGQQTPIEVCRLPGQRHWTLVAGAHRHAGAAKAGIAYLRAVVVGAGRDDRRLREVNENLWRKDLEPIDRAAFMAEAVAIHKRTAGITADADRAAKVKQSVVREVAGEAEDIMEIISMTYGWSNEVGQQLGFTGRTVRNDLYLYRRLAPSLVARLREARHPVARNAAQLRALAKLDSQTQALVVEKLLAGAKRVADALPGKPAPDAETKRFTTVLDTLSRMSAAQRIAIFQSPQFHNLIPAEAQRLLAPMRRDPTEV